MKKISEIIAESDEIKPNSFSGTLKLSWVNELEASVQAEIWGIATIDIQRHLSAEEGVLADDAHTRMYREYLCAMIDYANGEYDKYNNSMQIYEAAYEEYAKWYIRTYGHSKTSPGIYITAYGIAVKRGFEGTEEEWLSHIKGEKGEKGDKGDKGDTGVPGNIQAVMIEEWMWEGGMVTLDITSAESGIDPIAPGSPYVAVTSQSGISFNYEGDNLTISAEEIPQEPIYIFLIWG